MKKTYIIPTAKNIYLAAESSLLTGSLTGNEGNIGTGEGDAEETRRQGGSLWDSWND